MSYIIEIDCPPGNPRPPYYLEQVLRGTSLEPVEHSSAFFGNFTFEFETSPTPEDKKLIGERLKKLNADGAIRYASW